MVEEEMATVEERISALETFDLVDGQPNIEGPTFAVAFEAMSTTGYGHVDNKAFETKWTEEIDKVRQLVRAPLNSQERIHFPMLVPP